MIENGTSEGLKEGICSFCKIAATQKCSSCKIAYYCSREHQQLDWKSHSKICRKCPYELVEDPTHGLCYVTTRQIKIDEIVICDEPLLVQPDLLSKLGPCCLSCYIPLTIGNAKPCSYCGWLLCQSCTKHGPECELTMEYRKSKLKIPVGQSLDILNNVASVLRALALKKNNPMAYKKLMSLKRSSDLKIASISHFIAKKVKSEMKIDNISKVEICKIVGILRFNGLYFRTPLSFPCNAVFEKLSNLSHSCRPNCRFMTSYDANSERKFVVRATTTIPKGHPITITHTDLLLDTAQRTSILEQKRNFRCICERCKDPTEFGTMFSAVKCTRYKCDGNMLPPTFLFSGDEEKPDYVCNKCNAKKSSEAIHHIQGMASMELSMSDKNDVNRLKVVINDHSKILHENHCIIFLAECTLANAFKFSLLTKCPSDNELTECVELCIKLHSMMEILAPVEWALRGFFLNMQFACMKELFLRRHMLPTFNQRWVSAMQLMQPLSLLKDLERMEEASSHLMRNEQTDIDVGNLTRSARLIWESLNPL